MRDVIQPRAQALIPLVLFLLIFIGSGIYYSTQHHPFAFYQISPVMAIIPAILWAFMNQKQNFSQHMSDFLEGVRDENIIIMCLIYLLAGSFATLTQHIGSIEATVNLGLHIIPPALLLPGLFLIASFIATAMGTSMGTIATMAPLALSFATQTGLNCPLCVGAVVGGAMFGDNVSLVSDTTIASVSTQGANAKQKFLLNLRIALPAMVATIAIYLMHMTPNETVTTAPINYILILPYIIILVLSLIGFNVFAVLLWGITSAIVLGLIYTLDFTMATASQDLLKGCGSMQEILVLSLLIGGLSLMMHKQGGLEWIMSRLQAYWQSRAQSMTQRSGQFILCILISIADFCTANNTVAIILAGPLTKRLQQQARLSPERAACVIDIFSCVFQGLLPYSAQVLLASSIAGISPLTLIPYIYYCPLLGLATTVAIYFYGDKQTCPPKLGT